MIYQSKHLELHDLVPPEYIEKYTQYQLLMRFDPRILKGLDLLIDRFGPCYVNNWKEGGDLKNCGLRPESYYKKPSASQHLFGRAIDAHFRRTDPQEVRDEIFKKAHLYLPYITRVEDKTKTWVHIDCGNYEPGIKLIKV